MQALNHKSSHTIYLQSTYTPLKLLDIFKNEVFYKCTPVLLENIFLEQTGKIQENIREILEVC